MHKAGYYPLQKKVPILRAEAKSTKRGPPKPALTRQGKFLSNAPLRSWGAGQRKYNSPLPHFAGHLSPLYSCRTPSNGTSGGEVFLNPFCFTFYPLLINPIYSSTYVHLPLPMRLLIFLSFTDSTVLVALPEFIHLPHTFLSSSLPPFLLLIR